MKTATANFDHFGKASSKTPAEIRRACEILETSSNPNYIIKHNGNHIWLEMGQEKQEFWSPLLHLELRSNDDQTFIKGEYVKQPLLWVAHLLIRIVSVAIFTVSLVSIYLKSAMRESFKLELLMMFAMVTVWFAMFLVSQWNRKKASEQAEELRRLMENIVD
ncbi:MAG: hypothetical protein EOO50_09920 [Flavobacterium sp.]|uniref:hypothetical protein n=1 Tax=Flavobacterium sp. TaxID=239 RepID=UPI00121B2D4E|nr:hypothetical protein [Flavobacterium sp.]RZJ66383.1 MAG: hypothetical protein EOO50_09920 [Flavobacterium sp.]